MWTKELDLAFKMVKVAMTAAMEEGVMIYNTEIPTTVLTDWSKNRIGHILAQKHCHYVELLGCCLSEWKYFAFFSWFC